MFERGVIQEVRRATDLAELVAQYTPLRRVGCRYVCRCPFHEEKSPSFNVSPDVGLYFCFGCKVSGDAIRFVEHLEGLTFPEALRMLAERAGIELPETRDPAVVAEDRRRRGEQERLRAVCEVAAAYFEQCLRDEPLSEMARGALDDRGITADTIAQFRLGYAPARWDGLAEHLRRRGHSPADAEIAGLLISRRPGEWRDRFRHRLMFPVLDRSGKVVAFSGRILPSCEEIPEGIVPAETGKYINSPVSPIYTKGELLYALALARPAMRKSTEAVVVEGNFDVVQMHQHGFTNTVAPLGTSFTPEQAKLLRRSADRVTLVFDGDGAGRAAARGSHDTCEGAGLAARVGVLPKGTDPDSFLRAQGTVAMERVLAQPQGMIEWLIKDTVATVVDSIAGRVAAARELAPILCAITDPIELGVAVRRAAEGLLLEGSEVRQAIREYKEKQGRDAKPPFRAGPGVAADRPGITALGAPGDTSEKSAARALAAGIEAALGDRDLLGGALVEELAEHLAAQGKASARAVLLAARDQWRDEGRLHGPMLLELLDPKEPADAALIPWLTWRLMPIDDAALLERFPSALREAVERLRRCREAVQGRATRRESAGYGASGDRTSEVDVLERERQTRAGGPDGAPHDDGRGR